MKQTRILIAQNSDTKHHAIPRRRQDDTDQLRALFYGQEWIIDEGPLDEKKMIRHALSSMKVEEDLLQQLDA